MKVVATTGSGSGLTGDGMTVDDWVLDTLLTGRLTSERRGEEWLNLFDYAVEVC